jgi:extracellular elastinolytic metalloproteinase
VVVRNLDTIRNNDAIFSAPPDGQSGVLTVFRWTRSSPNRSGAFDNTLMAHELFHGITSRLTGGSQNSRCLLTLENRGMGTIH